MPSDIAQKALKNKAVTRRQYDKLPAPLLDKVAKHNLAMQAKSRKTPAKGGINNIPSFSPYYLQPILWVFFQECSY